MATQFLEQAMGRLAYDDAGQGPLVICVPGMGDLRQVYRFLIPAVVNAGYRAVSLDVRGHGETSVNWPDYSVAAVGADMLALARGLDAGPAILVGNSMAAGAAVWAAVEAPERVAGLVLIDPFVEGSASGGQKLMYSALFARPWGPAMWQKYYTGLYPTHKPEDFAAYSARLRANLTEPGRMEALRQMILASKDASGQRLARLATPTLTLMGAKDPDFKDPEAAARRVAEQTRGSYRLIPEAGHYPQAEMPALTTPLILEFLERVCLQPQLAAAAKG